MIKTGSLRSLADVQANKIYIITRSDKFGVELENAGLKVDGEHIIYLPDIAPSRDLLDRYHAYTKAVGASVEAFDNVYTPRYLEEIKTPQAQNIITKLAIESMKMDVAVVCFCPDDRTCHRSLVKQAIIERQQQILRKICTPVIVAGSRDFSDIATLTAVLDTYLDGVKNPIIVEGGAKGADTLAKEYAINHRINYKEFPADWDNLGKKAGYIRNKQMHVYANNFENKTICICFWNHESKGTAQNFNLSKNYEERLIVCQDSRVDQIIDIDYKEYDHQMDGNIEWEH